MAIVITGGIGSGKSTVMRHLSSLLPSFKVYSVDAEVARLYQSEPFQAMLLKIFGTVSKSEVSQKVFANPEMRAALEAESLKFLAPPLNAALNSADTLIEFPLFFERPDWVTQAKLSIVVVCDTATRRTRVAHRDPDGAKKFDAVDSTQHSTAVKEALADFVINTEGSITETHAQIERLLPTIRGAMLQSRCDSLFLEDSIRAQELLFPEYGRAYRGYHNLTHLAELYESLAVVYPDIPDSLQLAIWFHDFVYETRTESYPLNEALSAKALFDFAKTTGRWERCARFRRDVLVAAEIIIATKTHTVSSPYLVSKPELLRDAHLFLDADLAILGASKARLVEYDEGVAIEWEMHSKFHPAEYAAGRKSALEALQARSKLYVSTEFQHLETKARNNLATLIGNLGQ